MAELKKGRKVKSTLKMYPQGTLQLILQYFTSSAAASEPRTVMASSRVFRVPLSTVTEYVCVSVCLHVYVFANNIQDSVYNGMHLAIKNTYS